MSKPRIHILALGGTLATRPDASGAMQMGLGADVRVLAVPLLGKLAEIEAETVSRVGSHSLSFDQIHELAAKIRSLRLRSSTGATIDACARALLRAGRPAGEEQRKRHHRSHRPVLPGMGATAQVSATHSSSPCCARSHQPTVTASIRRAIRWAS